MTIKNQKCLVAIASAIIMTSCNRFEQVGPQVVTPSPSPTSTSSSGPNPTPTTSSSLNSSVTGLVVDQTTNSPLPDQTVSLAPLGLSVPGEYRKIATTATNGMFSFTTAPGKYLLAIGSNNSSDTMRATEHDVITLSDGTNNLKAEQANPETDVTLQRSQTTGNFRLTTLTTAEAKCLTAANIGRKAHNESAFIEDEYALENSRAVLQEQEAQQTINPYPLSSMPELMENNYGQAGFFASGAYTDCNAFANTYSFNQSSPAYETATGASSWYAGSSDGKYSDEYFAYDLSESTSQTDTAKSK